MAPRRGVSRPDAAPDDQRRRKHAAGGPRPERDHQRPELGNGDAQQLPDREPIIQHLADGVVAGAKDLRVKVSDDAEQQSTKSRGPDRGRLQREMIVKQVFEEEQDADYADSDDPHHDAHQGEEPQLLHAGQRKGRGRKQRHPAAEVHGDGRGHDGGNGHGNKGARPEFE